MSLQSGIEGPSLSSKDRYFTQGITFHRGLRPLSPRKPLLFWTDLRREQCLSTKLAQWAELANYFGLLGIVKGTVTLSHNCIEIVVSVSCSNGLFEIKFSKNPSGNKSQVKSWEYEIEMTQFVRFHCHRENMI